MSDSSSPSTHAPTVQHGRWGLFRWQCEPDGVSSVSLRLHGELDLAGAAELRYALLTVEQSAVQISVDLGKLEFIDCAALGALDEAAARAAGRGKKLILFGGSGQVRRVLELTGTPGGAEHRRLAPRLELVGGGAAQEKRDRDAV